MTCAPFHKDTSYNFTTHTFWVIDHFVFNSNFRRMYCHSRPLKLCIFMNLWVLGGNTCGWNINLQTCTYCNWYLYEFQLVFIWILVIRHSATIDGHGYGGAGPKWHIVLPPKICMKANCQWLASNRNLFLYCSHSCSYGCSIDRKCAIWTPNKNELKLIKIFINHLL